MKEIAKADPERANVLVIIAIPPGTLYPAWRTHLEQRLERIRVDGINCMHFGPSCSVALDPFRRKRFFFVRDKIQ